MSASRNLQKVLGKTSNFHKATQGTRGLKELAALAAHSKLTSMKYCLQCMTIHHSFLQKHPTNHMKIVLFMISNQGFFTCRQRADHEMVE